MIKTKQIDAILDMYQIDLANSDKLNAISAIANNQKNKVLNIALDPNLSMEQKLLQIKENVKETAKRLKRNTKWGRIIGTAFLILYSVLQTIGVI